MTDRPVRIAHCAGGLWDRFSGLRDALGGPVDVVTVGLLAERFDHGWAHATVGRTEEHRYLDPETFTAETGLGAHQGVTDQVAMSATPGHDDPVLVARGSSERAWR